MTARNHGGEIRPRPSSHGLLLGAPPRRGGESPPRRSPILSLFLTPDIGALGRRNRVSIFAFSLLAVAGGSGASVAAAVLASWAAISMALGRFRFRLELSDYPVVLASLSFFAVIAASDLAHTELGPALRSIVALLPFVFPLLLIPRLRLAGSERILPPAFLGAAVGGVLLIPIVAAEYSFLSPRVQALAGNPGPLSVVGLLCAGWSILHFSRVGGRWQNLLAFAGAVGGSLAVILSGMRGAWPLLPVCIALALFSRRRELAAVWRDTQLPARAVVLGGGALILLIVGLVVMPSILGRLDEMWTDLGLIAANVDTPTSLNMRKEMYGAAWSAIEAQPWFGYGAENHWQAVTPYLSPASFDGRTFTHFHNVFLTVGVDAGVIGVAALAALVLAPLWTAWRARATPGGTRRLGASLILVVAFLGAGMTNIMLFHDILDAVWVFSVSLIAASVPPSGACPATGTAGR